MGTRRFNINFLTQVFANMKGRDCTVFFFSDFGGDFAAQYQIPQVIFELIFSNRNKIALKSKLFLGKS